MNICWGVYNRIHLVLNVSWNIGSRSVGTVNILEVITRCTEVEIKKEEIGQDTQLLQSLKAVIDDAPSPADNLTSGLPIKKGALLPPAITWIKCFMEFDRTITGDKA